MNEQVLSTRVRGDEAEALCGVEPSMIKQLVRLASNNKQPRPTTRDTALEVPIHFCLTESPRETYHFTVPDALLSAIAKILGTVKLRTGALARRAWGALSLRKPVRPRRVAAGLKLNNEFMKQTKCYCGLPSPCSEICRPTRRLGDCVF